MTKDTINQSEVKLLHIPSINPQDEEIIKLDDANEPENSNNNKNSSIHHHAGK